MLLTEKIMETKIKGMQVTKVDIKKQCRETHGKSGALDEAFKIIKQRYDFTVNAECNENATFTLCLTVDRE